MNRIKEKREAAGVQQKDLYLELEWNQPRLSHYESGARTPGLKESRQIVAALSRLGVSCTLDDVFPCEDGAA